MSEKITYKQLAGIALNLSHEELDSLFVDSDTNEFRSNADEVYREKLAAHIKNVEANADFTQSPKYKKRVEELRIEFSQRSAKDISKLQAALDAANAVKTGEDLNFIKQIADAKAEGDAKEAKLKAEFEAYKANEVKKERSLRLNSEIRKALPLSKFSIINPEAIEDAIELIRMKEVSEFIEKDGVIYPLNLEGKPITHGNGHNVTLSEIGFKQLSKIGTPLVQPPSGGAGNTNSVNTQISYDANYYKGDN